VNPVLFSPASHIALTGKSFPRLIFLPDPEKDDPSTTSNPDRETDKM